MIAASLYCRKSTAQDGVADAEKSVSRQIEHGRAFAAKKGWVVADEHIYTDDACSGSEFGERRPGLLRLMNSLKPKAPFQVLIMSEESRLGREMTQTMGALGEIVRAGVRVFYYMDDKEATLNSPIEKAMMMMGAFSAELEREKARQRTSDAMLRKARAGHVCGGHVFGYTNVRLDSHVARVVNESEAAIVRRIFELCAAGSGAKTIAKLLNAEHAPSPRPQQGRSNSWAPSSVRAVLYRELFRGVAVYNKTAKRDSWGIKKPSGRPEADWIRVPAPALRIVSDDLWNRAHARLDAARRVYLHKTNGSVWGRPAVALQSKYLLSGLLRCACCGCAMTVRSSPRLGHRAFNFICTGYDHRGTSVCTNNLPLPMDLADAAIIEKLRRYVLDPEIVEGALADALQELRPAAPGAVDDKRAGLQAELRRVEAGQSRYVAAIGVAGHVDALARALQDGEEQRLRLVRELATLDSVAKLTSRDVTAIQRSLNVRLKMWRHMLTRQTPLARQAVSELLDGHRIAWTPRRDEGRYEFSGRAKLDNVLMGVINLTQGVTSPAGFEPAFWP
jgi:site-specific DNA recombinase